MTLSYVARDYNVPLYNDNNKSIAIAFVQFILVYEISNKVEIYVFFTSTKMLGKQFFKLVYLHEFLFLNNIVRS